MGGRRSTDAGRCSPAPVFETGPFLTVGAASADPDQLFAGPVVPSGSSFSARAVVTARAGREVVAARAPSKGRRARASGRHVSPGPSSGPGGRSPPAVCVGGPGRIARGSRSRNCLEIMRAVDRTTGSQSYEPSVPRTISARGIVDVPIRAAAWDIGNLTSKQARGTAPQSRLPIPAKPRSSRCPLQTHPNPLSPRFRDVGDGGPGPLGPSNIAETALERAGQRQPRKIPIGRQPRGSGNIQVDPRF